MDGRADTARDRLVSLLYVIRCCWFYTQHAPAAETNLVCNRTATILITITQYGVPKTGPWLLAVVEGLFWVYIGVSFLVSAGLYLTLWSTQ